MKRQFPNDYIKSGTDKKTTYYLNNWIGNLLTNKYDAVGSTYEIVTGCSPLEGSTIHLKYHTVNGVSASLEDLIKYEKWKELFEILTKRDVPLNPGQPYLADFEFSQSQQNIHEIFCGTELGPKCLPPTKKESKEYENVIKEMEQNKANMQFILKCGINNYYDKSAKRFFNHGADTSTANKFFNYILNNSNEKHFRKFAYFYSGLIKEEQAIKSNDSKDYIEAWKLFDLSFKISYYEYSSIGNNISYGVKELNYYSYFAYPKFYLLMQVALLKELSNILSYLQNENKNAGSLLAYYYLTLKDQYNN